MINIYNTDFMLSAIENTHTVSKFLSNRYFPLGRMFKTSYVIVEYKDRGKKMAPFVIPYSNGKPVEREGYRASRMEPAFINPVLELSIDQLFKKGFKEAIYSEVTPEERAMEYLADDLATLEQMIQRSEEWMASELLQNGKITVNIYKEKYGEGTPRTFTFTFFDGEFKNIYAPAVKWGQEGADIYGDVVAMCQSITNGSDPTDLILGMDACNKFMTDEKILKLLDTRNLNIGHIEPGSLGEHVKHIGTMNFAGNMLNVLYYNEMVTDLAGQSKYFWPVNKVMVASPEIGATDYAAITQMEQADREFHTYPNSRVPRFLANAHAQTREVGITSAPLPHPFEMDAWRVAEVCD